MVNKRTKKQMEADMLAKATEAMSEKTNPETGVEHWTQNAFNSYIKMLLEDYPKGNDFYKKHTWADVSKMIDDVLSGKIVVDSKSAVVV